MWDLLVCALWWLAIGLQSCSSCVTSRSPSLLMHCSLRSVQTRGCLPMASSSDRPWILIFSLQPHEVGKHTAQLVSHIFRSANSPGWEPPWCQACLSRCLIFLDVGPVSSQSCSLFTVFYILCSLFDCFYWAGFYQFPRPLLVEVEVPASLFFFKQVFNMCLLYVIYYFLETPSIER